MQVSALLKLNESRYKQNLFKKNWEKINIDAISWETLFHLEKSIQKKYREKLILTQSIEKSFLIDPVMTNDSLTLS